MFPFSMIVLRHGETRWNAENRLQGGRDSPLTPLGEEQARRQAALLGGLDLAGHSLWTSPQGRAARTAAIAFAGLGRAPRRDPRLREIGMGDWSGQRIDEVRASMPAAFAGDSPFGYYDHAPGGEGLAALAERCAAFLADLDGPAVVVTHGITSRMLRALALEGSPDGFDRLPGGQGVLHLVGDGVHRTLG